MIDVFPFRNVQTGYKALARRGHLGSTARACLRGVAWGSVARVVEWRTVLSKLTLRHHRVTVRNERAQRILPCSQKSQLSENLTPRRVFNMFWKMKCHVSEDPKRSLGLFCTVEQQVLWHFRKYYRTSFPYPWTSILPFLWRWVQQWTSILVISGAGALHSSPSVESSGVMRPRTKLLATKDRQPPKTVLSQTRALETKPYLPPSKACFILNKICKLWDNLFFRFS